MKGFTFLELLICIAVMLIMLSFALPAYRRGASGRAVQSAARFFESAYAERKERAVALGTETGLCVSPSGVVSTYEFNPFAPSAGSLGETSDLGKDFSVAVSVNVLPDGAPPGPAPCPAGDSAVQLSPGAGASEDWSGTIEIQSGEVSRRVLIQGGTAADAP